MKRTIFFCALLALFTGANAQKTTDYKEKHPYKDWVKLAPKLDDAFFTTPEAVRIADNVLLYQQTTGGWPKNIYMPAELTADEYQKALADKDNVNQSTIDNNATSTEIRYLSRIYLATGIEQSEERIKLWATKQIKDSEGVTAAGLSSGRAPKVIIPTSPTTTMQW